jgi:hypothetical protein
VGSARQTHQKIMSKQYAVLHIEKGKGVGGGVGNHIDRTLGQEHTFPHADPKRLHLNVDYTPKKYATKTVPEAIEHRIANGYKGHKKMRSDSVKFLSSVLTGTHEQMIKIEQDGKLNQWVADNLEFMKAHFGEENIIRFTLHLDEKTPHLHCLHVPLTKDGRLSAKEVMGDRLVLKRLQDDYSQKMAKYGLVRGEAREGVFHETAQEYYRRINITENFIENLNVDELIGIDKEDTIQKLKSSLKTLKMELVTEKKESSIAKSLHKSSQEALRNVKTKLKEAEKTIENQEIAIEKLLENPNLYEKYRAQHLENLKKLEEEEKTKKKNIPRRKM